MNSDRNNGAAAQQRNFQRFDSSLTDKSGMISEVDSQYHNRSHQEIEVESSEGQAKQSAVASLPTHAVGNETKSQIRSPSILKKKSDKKVRKSWINRLVNRLIVVPPSPKKDGSRRSRQGNSDNEMSVSFDEDMISLGSFASRQSSKRSLISEIDSNYDGGSSIGSAGSPSPRKQRRRSRSTEKKEGSHVADQQEVTSLAQFATSGNLPLRPISTIGSGMGLAASRPSPLSLTGYTSVETTRGGSSTDVRDNFGSSTASAPLEAHHVYNLILSSDEQRDIARLETPRRDNSTTATMAQHQQLLQPLESSSKEANQLSTSNDETDFLEHRTVQQHLQPPSIPEARGGGEEGSNDQDDKEESIRTNRSAISSLGDSVMADDWNLVQLKDTKDGVPSPNSNTVADVVGFPRHLLAGDVHPTKTTTLGSVAIMGGSGTDSKQNDNPNGGSNADIDSRNSNAKNSPQVAIARDWKQQRPNTVKVRAARKDQQAPIFVRRQRAYVDRSLLPSTNTTKASEYQKPAERPVTVRPKVLSHGRVAARPIIPEELRRRPTNSKSVGSWGTQTRLVSPTESSTATSRHVQSDDEPDRPSATEERQMMGNGEPTSLAGREDALSVVSASTASSDAMAHEQEGGTSTSEHHVSSTNTSESETVDIAEDRYVVDLAAAEVWARRPEVSQAEISSLQEERDQALARVTDLETTQSVMETRLTDQSNVFRAEKTSLESRLEEIQSNMETTQMRLNDSEASKAEMEQKWNESQQKIKMMEQEQKELLARLVAHSNAPRTTESIVGIFRTLEKDKLSTERKCEELLAIQANLEEQLAKSKDEVASYLQGQKTARDQAVAAEIARTETIQRLRDAESRNETLQKEKDQVIVEVESRNLMLSGQVQLLRTEVSSKSGHIEAVESDLAQARKRLEEAETKLEDVNKELCESKKENLELVDDLKSQRAAMETEALLSIRAHEEAKTAIEKKLKYSESTNSDLNARLRKCEVKIDSLNKEHRDVEIRAEAAERERDEALRSRQDCQVTISNLKAENDTLAETLEQLQLRVTETEKLLVENARLEEEMKKLEDTNKLLTSKTTQLELDAANASERHQESQSRYAELESTAANMQSKYQELLSEKMAVDEHLQKTQELSEAQLLHARDDAMKMQLDNERLDRLVKELRALNEDIGTQKQSLESRVVDLEDMNNSASLRLANTMEEAQKSLAIRQSKLDDLKASNAENASRLQKADFQIEEEMARRLEMEEQLQQAKLNVVELEESVRHSVDKVASLEAELAEAKVVFSDLAAAKSENASINSKLGETDAAYRIAISQNEEMTKKLELAEEMVSSLQRDQEEAGIRIMELESDVTLKSSIADEAQQKIIVLENEKTSLENTIADLKVLVENSSSREASANDAAERASTQARLAQEQFAEMKASRDGIAKEFDGLRAASAAAADKAITKEKEIETLKHLNASLDQCRAEIEEKNTSLESQIEAAASEASALKAQIVEIESSKVTIEARNVELHDRLAVMDETVNSLEKGKVELEAQIQCLESDVASKSTRADNAERNLSVFKRKLSSLQEGIRNDRKAAENHVITLKASMEKSRIELAVAKADIQIEKDRMRSLEDTVQELEASKANLMKMVGDLESSILESDMRVLAANEESERAKGALAVVQSQLEELQSIGELLAQTEAQRTLDSERASKYDKMVKMVLNWWFLESCRHDKDSLVDFQKTLYERRNQADIQTSNLEDQLEQTTDEMVSLQAEANSLNVRIEAIAVKKLRLADEKNGELSSDDQIMDMDLESQTLQSQFKAIESNLEDSVARFDEAQQALNSMNEQTAAIESLIDELQEMIDNYPDRPIVGSDRSNLQSDVLELKHSRKEFPAPLSADETQDSEALSLSSHSRGNIHGKLDESESLTALNRILDSPHKLAQPSEEILSVPAENENICSGMTTEPLQDTTNSTGVGANRGAPQNSFAEEADNRKDKRKAKSQEDLMHDLLAEAGKVAESFLESPTHSSRRSVSLTQELSNNLSLEDVADTRDILFEHNNHAEYKDNMEVQPKNLANSDPLPTAKDEMNANEIANVLSVDASSIASKGSSSTAHMSQNGNLSSSSIGRNAMSLAKDAVSSNVPNQIHLAKQVPGVLSGSFRPYYDMIDEFSTSFSQEIVTSLISESSVDNGDSDVDERVVSFDVASESGGGYVCDTNCLTDDDGQSTSQRSAATASSSFAAVRVTRFPIELELHYHNERSYMHKARYSGPLLNGLPDGMGVLWFDTGDMYVGEFHMGEMHGVGAFNHKNIGKKQNELFRGEFKHNEFVNPTIQRVSIRQSKQHLPVPPPAVDPDPELVLEDSGDESC